ncbi:hypothetical protein HER21_28625 [Pseudomonas sp. BGM005]|nr:hypothetical protein [Pseudomonas sp. BG5]
MELNQWIESVGGLEATGRLSLAALGVVASLLDEKPRTVLSWYRKERKPSFEAGVKILSKSQGRVDWNGIYHPYVADLSKAEQPCR